MYSITVVFQILINGILLGCMYGMAAIGLSLIFGSMRIIFLAQGSVIVLAAYCVFWINTYFGMDPFVSLIICLPVFIIFGWLMYRGLFRRVAHTPSTSLLLSFGIMAMLENTMSVLWTPSSRAITTAYSGLSLRFSGLNVSVSRIGILVLALVSTVTVYFFLTRTMWGKAVRGASEDMKAAEYMGISPVRVSALTFAIGIGLAGIAGVSMSATYAFDPYFGFLFSLKAMIAVAFGGLGSVVGAALGGIILGVLEAFGSYCISSGWADAISYAAFLLVLMLKPEGFFGRTVNKA